MFHNRQQLIEWLENNPPTKTIGRAISEGTIEVYGIFKNIQRLPGWIVHVTSTHGQEWDVAILNENHHLIVGIMRKVVWKNWIKNGDKPEHYKSLRANALSQQS